MTDLITQKESPLKMLLTSPTNSIFVNAAYNQMNLVSNTNTTHSDGNEDGATRLITYYQFATTGEKEMDPISMDHCYARPWNWRPETSFIRPTKTLFMPKFNAKPTAASIPIRRTIEGRDTIDVERVSPTPLPIYDMEKAIDAMDECEQFAIQARGNDYDNDDWEESVPKENWSSTQNRLFINIVKILNSDRMSRLTYSGSWNEPVIRRTVIDKSVQRFRSLMSSVAWDGRLIQWLHGLLLDHLNTPYLAAYLDILQTLKSKLPTFVDKMMFGPNAMANRSGPTSNENLFPLLKYAWDPVANSLAIQEKPKRLPGNPIIIIAPSAVYVTGNSSKRLHKWTNLLSALAHVIVVQANLGAACLRMNMMNCADHLFNVTRTKIQEVRNDCPGRPIILVGFNTGAAVACQVAEVEHVVALVCMGFPLLTAEGKRGEPDDYLLDIQYPVLFVIGQNSHRTSREDMEDLRERMRVETGLVVVGSADDYLRVDKSKRRMEGITQSIVDRCIFDEIGEFVGSVLLAPYPSIPRQASNYVTDHYNTKQMKVRIRNNSNGSSIESEPPSPQPIRYKQVGRPPNKKKLFQTFPGSPNSSTTQTNSTSSSSSSSLNPVTIPNDSNSTGLLPLVPKPDFRDARAVEALNRAVQSILPTSTSQTSPLPLTSLIPSRSVMTGGSTLSALLQKGVQRNVKPVGNRPAGLKILENITITPAGSSKLLPSGRSISLNNATRTVGNMVIGNVRNPNSTNIRTTTVQNRPGRKPKQQLITNTGITKLVPTRRQITTKPRVPTECTLTPPANLTTADIMDLPIIFADGTPIDNITTNTDTGTNINSNDELTQIELPPPKPSSSKLVVINKPAVTSTPSTISLKRSVTPTSNQAMKYAKIIVSKRSNEDKARKKSEKLPMSFEGIDLESELKATAVPNPMFMKKSEGKPFVMSNKQATFNIDGKMTNVTLRVPVTFARSTGTQSRLVTSNEVTNRTVTIQSKQTNVKMVENETETEPEPEK